MLSSILSNASNPSVTLGEFLLCTGAAILLGMIIAWIHTYKNHASGNFLLTLALLPAVVSAVIMLVNGNLGTGVAVMGAFGLVRFRSMPGNSREIGSVFLAMAVGLATGMGYLGIAALLVLIIGAVTVLLVGFSGQFYSQERKELRVTIPENLDYDDVFEDLFEKYTKNAELIRVRTVSMGSLYELQYYVDLKDKKNEKEFLDEIRCRNGNLSLVCGRIAAGKEEL